MDMTTETPRTPDSKAGTWVTVSPEDLHPLSALKASTPAEVSAAVARASAAQIGWAARPFSERHAALKGAATQMLVRRGEVLALMREEVGKMELEGLMSEALGPLDQVNSWAKVIGPALEPTKVSLNPLSFPKKRARVFRVPRGVVGVIAPWNYPLANHFRTVLPALLAGNAVVLKPSEFASRTARWFAEQLSDFLPPGLLQVVVGDGQVGTALIHSGIQSCIFTGSVTTGKAVAKTCAENMIPCSVELGGNDGAIVLADCDMARAVAGITHWALHNAGQACGSVEVLYVEESIADEFVDRLVSAWAKLKVGAAPAGEVDVSPLSTEKQLAVVEEHVADAQSKGARTLLGGKRLGRGLFYLPTILDRCTSSMKVVQEETFGPVLPIVRVQGAAEAISLINRGRFGLTASIWTKDLSRAERLAQDLDVGTVTINNHSITGAMANLPWSGTKDSGTGIANSSLSLGSFLRPKTVLVDEQTQPEIYWMPFDKNLMNLGHLLADLQVGKLSGVFKLPLLMRKRVQTLKEFFRF